MNDDFSALEEATMRIDELEYELSDAELKIQRVRELHKPSEEDYFGPVCIECDFGRYSCGCGGWVEWPCDTIKALDGENNG